MPDGQTQKETHAALEAPKTLVLTSTAFAQGRQIPREYTCHGDDASPPLDVGGLPRDAAALAVVVDDPDAARGTFTHWTAWDLRPVAALPRGVDVLSLGGVEGRNDFGSVGWRGPCPPAGAPHRYVFRAFALREKLGLAPNAAPQEVWRALEGKVLGWGDLTGTFQKP